jgi:XTP/dITP diphosphohydrolase
MAQEHPDSPFGIDDVAGGIVDKLVRRHPHVFAEVDSAADVKGDAEGDVKTAEDVAVSWERIKADEKPHRSSPLDGIPEGLPALARATKAADRLQQAGLGEVMAEAAQGDEVGPRLLTLVLEARRTGVDPEAALRAVVRDLAAAARTNQAGSDQL